MRLAHFGDLHIREGARGEDAHRCVMAGLDDAEQQGADLIIFPGDLFHSKSTPTMRNQLLRVLQRAACLAPVVGVYGNHDCPADLEIYRSVKARYDITIYDRPALESVVTRAANVLVAFLPYPTKAWLHAQNDLTAPQADQQAASALSSLLTTWGAQVRAHDGPSLFIGHINVAGSRASTGQPLIGRELEVAPGDLLDVGVMYYALGHIHARQSFAPHCWYAGSVSRMDFGEAEEKGWNLVTIADGETTIEFRPLPARKMLQIEARWTESGWDFDAHPAPEAGADVRFRYRVEEHMAANVDEDMIRRAWEDAHALKIERVIVRSDRVRSEEISAAKTLAAKLEAYWAATERPADDVAARVLEKVDALQSSPSEAILEEVSRVAV